MKRFRAEFDEAFQALWPCFDYLKRTSTVSETINKNEFKFFQIISKDENKPPAKSPPASEIPTMNEKKKNDAFFTSTKFNANNDLKITGNPAKLTGLKVPDPYFVNEPPLLKPDVQMISNPIPSEDNSKNPPPITNGYVPERRSSQQQDQDDPQ